MVDEINRLIYIDDDVILIKFARESGVAEFLCVTYEMVRCQESRQFSSHSHHANLAPGGIIALWSEAKLG